MRHFIFGFFTFLFLSCSTVLHAQEFRFGIHATPLLSFLSTDMPEAKTGSKLLFGYGGLAEYRFGDNYSINSGFEIIRRGANLTVDDTTGSLSPNYLQFPILLKMRTREFGYFTFYAEFGGALAFRTSHNMNYDPPLASGRQTERINLFNATFRFGLGAEYSFGGSTSVMVGLNYNRSLIDNIDRRAYGVSREYNYRLDYVALTTGVLF